MSVFYDQCRCENCLEKASVWVEVTELGFRGSFCKPHWEDREDKVRKVFGNSFRVVSENEVRMRKALV